MPRRIGVQSKILRVAAEIQAHSQPVIEHCYREFLLQNSDAEERAYPDAADQISEVLIRGNYLSQKDVEMCRHFELGSLETLPEYENIRELHDTLVATYGA